MKNVNVEEIKKVMVDWINESMTDVIETVYNENFDGTIKYDTDSGMFEISDEEAERIGV